MEADPYIGATFYFNAQPQIEDAPRGGNGSQVLPVAELSSDFDGTPQDGMEYLFLVRREAASHAKVYRAAFNPYEAPSQVDPRTMQAEKVHSSRPSEAWRSAFVEKFKQTRFRMATPPFRGSIPKTDSNEIPAPRQESAWRIFVNGKRSKPVKPPPRPNPPTATSNDDTEMSDLESAKAAVLASLELDTPPTTSSLDPPLPLPPPPAPSRIVPLVPEYDKLPQLPTPALVLSIPSTSIIHVLGHFAEWFEERSRGFEQELNWVPSTIFAPIALRKKPIVPAASTAIGARAATIGGGGTRLEKVNKEKEKLKGPLPSPHEVHWILSLLSRLSDLLDGDDLSSLRLLARTVVDMVEGSEKTSRGKGAVTRREDKEEEEEEEEEEGRARCWMIVAAIAGVWKQEDLWNMNL